MIGRFEEITSGAFCMSHGGLRSVDYDIGNGDALASMMYCTCMHAMCVGAFVSIGREVDPVVSSARTHVDNIATHTVQLDCSMRLC